MASIVDRSTWTASIQARHHRPPPREARGEGQSSRAPLPRERSDASTGAAEPNPSVRDHSGQGPSSGQFHVKHPVRLPIAGFTSRLELQVRRAVARSRSAASASWRLCASPQQIGPLRFSGSHSCRADHSLLSGLYPDRRSSFRLYSVSHTISAACCQMLRPQVPRWMLSTRSGAGQPDRSTGRSNERRVGRGTTGGDGRSGGEQRSETEGAVGDGRGGRRRKGQSRRRGQAGGEACRAPLRRSRRGVCQRLTNLTPGTFTSRPFTPATR